MTDIALHQADALQFLPQMAANSVDLIVTDPAYESLDKHRAIGTTTRLKGGGHADPDNRDSWFQTISNAELFDLLFECRRVLKPNSHLWMMCDHETLGYILGFLREGLMETEGVPAKERISYVKCYPVIKIARNGGLRQGMGWHGRGCHEFLVLAKKGNRPLNDRNWPDIFTPIWDGDSDSARYTPDGEPFPTAKPVSLFERIIELSSIEGETVFDPFCGSGASAAAAVGLKRQFVGLDKNAYALATTRARLDALNPQEDFNGRLFTNDAEVPTVRRNTLSMHGLAR